MRVSITILVFLSLSLSLSLVFAVSAVDATVVKVDPASQTLSPGDSFSVNVCVEDVTYMGADQAWLNFDTGAMNATAIIEGDFLKSAGSTLPIELIDNTAGAAAFAYAVIVEEGGVGVTNTGVLATIYFDTDASAEGTFALILTDVELLDEDNNPITVDQIVNGEVSLDSTRTPLTVEITAPEDGHWFDSEPVNVTFHQWNNVNQELNYTIFVDGGEKASGTAPNCTETEVNLGELSECDHVIRVTVTDDIGFEGSDEVTVHVDLTPPIEDILSPEEGMIYGTACIGLNFTAEDTGICPSGIAEIYYKLDGGGPVTMPEPGNAIISDVGPCEHTVVVYVKDKAGKENSSSAVSFTAHPGDINGDGGVNVLDLQRLAWAFNLQPGDPNWNPDADLNCDNKFNVFDLQILAWNFGNDYTEIC